MAATATDIKNATSYDADAGNPITEDAFSTTNAHLTNIGALIEWKYDFTATHGRAPNETDIARIMKERMLEWYKSVKREKYIADYAEATTFNG